MDKCKYCGNLKVLTFADEIITQLRRRGLINKLKYIYRFFPKFEVINK